MTAQPLDYQLMIKKFKKPKVSVINTSQKKKEVHVILNGPVMTVHTYFYSYIVFICWFIRNWKCSQNWWPYRRTSNGVLSWESIKCSTGWECRCSSGPPIFNWRCLVLLKGRKTVMFGYARYAIVYSMAVNQSSQLFMSHALNGIILAVLD